MKRSKFSEAQIAFVLKQADDGTSVGEVCRKTGISEATYYNWRKRYAGLMPSEMKRLRQFLRSFEKNFLAVLRHIAGYQRGVGWRRMKLGHDR